MTDKTSSRVTYNQEQEEKKALLFCTYNGVQAYLRYWAKSHHRLAYRYKQGKTYIIFTEDYFYEQSHTYENGRNNKYFGCISEVGEIVLDYRHVTYHYTVKQVGNCIEGTDKPNKLAQVLPTVCMHEETYMNTVKTQLTQTLTQLLYSKIHNLVKNWLEQVCKDIFSSLEYNIGTLVDKKIQTMVDEAMEEIVVQANQEIAHHSSESDVSSDASYHLDILDPKYPDDGRQFLILQWYDLARAICSQLPQEESDRLVKEALLLTQTKVNQHLEYNIEDVINGNRAYEVFYSLVRKEITATIKKLYDQRQEQYKAERKRLEIEQYRRENETD